MQDTKLAKGTGFLAVTASILLIISFIGLKFTFGYPSIIRADYIVILENLYKKRGIVPYLFYLIGLSGFLII